MLFVKNWLSIYGSLIQRHKDKQKHLDCGTGLIGKNTVVISRAAMFHLFLRPKLKALQLSADISIPVSSGFP